MRHYVGTQLVLLKKIYFLDKQLRTLDTLQVFTDCVVTVKLGKLVDISSMLSTSGYSCIVSRQCFLRFKAY